MIILLITASSRCHFDGPVFFLQYYTAQRFQSPPLMLKGFGFSLVFSSFPWILLPSLCSVPRFVDPFIWWLAVDIQTAAGSIVCTNNRTTTDNNNINADEINLDFCLFWPLNRTVCPPRPRGSAYERLRGPRQGQTTLSSPKRDFMSIIIQQ